MSRQSWWTHISARRIKVNHLEEPIWSATPQYQVLPCPNYFKIKEKFSNKAEIGANLYRTTADDNMIGMSQEDWRFLEIMEAGIHKNERGNWEMPLPSRPPNNRMPNNRSLVVNRLNGLLRTLKKTSKMKEDYLQFMGKLFERNHAVPVPDEELARNDGRVWYLPHFGVYHPKKPEQIRVVFDTSAEYQGVSLNKRLLPGPDLMNSLMGVLNRFRQEPVGIMCDVEQMFHSFHMNVEHQDILRFLWYKDNDPSKEIREYKMTVHLFGTAPSLSRRQQTSASRNTAKRQESS